MAKNTVTTPPLENSVEATVATAKTPDATVDLSGVEKRLSLVESRLDEISTALESLKAAAPADSSGLVGTIAALEARVSSYIGRGR